MVIGFSRTHQYYQHKQPAKDWHTKQLIETHQRMTLADLEALEKSVLHRAFVNE